jgi:hypothetical protein
MEMRQIQHIVQIFLDIERPSKVNLKREWVKNRIEFFNKFTLRSLLNQSTQAFKIYLICGRRHKDLTSSIPFHKRVTVVYPDGDPSEWACLTQSPNLPDRIPTTWIKEYTETKFDYLAITRLDSDDMMSRHAMREIINVSENILLRQERTRMVYRKFWRWHLLDRVLEQQRRDNPPFYTHIFPKDVCRDWKRFGFLHFNNHRYVGGPGDEPLELSPNMICVCNHQENISRIKRGRPVKFMRSCERRVLIKNNPGSTDDRRKIIEILKPFGVKERNI